MNVKAIHNQSVLDASIQEFGSVSQTISVALANDVSITDMLAVGTDILVPDVVPNDVRIQNYYKRNQISPTSYLDVVLTGLGISYTIVKPKGTDINLTEHSQSSLDLALQYSGGMESLFELCDNNDIGITQYLDAGTALKTNITLVDQDVLDYYKKKNIRPATASEIVVPEGYSIEDYVLTNYWL